MREYVVEVRGETREFYCVKADSPEDAAENWAEGTFINSEAIGGFEVYDVHDVRDETED